MLTRQQIIDTARSYIGTPYQAGGSTSEGMSCAGLLVAIGRDTGYLTEEIPGLSSFNEASPMDEWFDQYLDKLPSIEDAQPGDIVSMLNSDAGAQHCAVVISTDPRGVKYWYFVHSLRNHGVVHGRLFGPYLRGVTAAYKLKGVSD